MRAPPLAINDLEPPDCFSYALNSVNLTIPFRGGDPPYSAGKVIGSAKGLAGAIARLLGAAIVDLLVSEFRGKAEGANAGRSA